MQNKLLKNEKGSITLFVLLAILFFLIVIFSLFITSSNKNTIQSSEIDKIKEEYQESVDNIDQIYSDTASKNITNYLKIGDYVNYTPDTNTAGYTTDKLSESITGSTDNTSIIKQDNLKWRIMNIDASGRVDLISETPTNQDVYFDGARGYNNGVYVINDICKSLYSNSSLGIIARNLDLKDIEDKMNDAGRTARDNYNKDSSMGPQYGHTKTYGSGDNQYPELYARENGSGINTKTVKTDGIDVNEDGYSEPTTTETSSIAEEGLLVTQTYYHMSSPSSYFEDQEFYDMIFNTERDYWLASRYANCHLGFAHFGLRYVTNSYFGGYELFYSYGFTFNTSFCLRPVVSLSSDIQITPVENADGNSPENMHQISKKIAK